MPPPQHLSTRDKPPNGDLTQDVPPERLADQVLPQDLHPYRGTNGHLTQAFPLDRQRMANGPVTQDRLEANRHSTQDSDRPARQALPPDSMANGHLTQDFSPERLAGRGLGTQDLDGASGGVLTVDLYQDRDGDPCSSINPPQGGDTEADLMMGEEGQADRCPTGQLRCPTGQVKQGTCCSRCRSEFRLRNFSLSHPNPELFYSCQWRWPPLVFLLYRVLVAGYILVWLVITGVNFPKELPFPWPVWLTNWSYLLLTCHLVLALVIAVVHHGSTRGQGVCGCCRRSSSYSSQDWHPPHSSSGILGDSSTTEGAATGSSSEFTVDFEQLPDALPWYVKLDWLLFAVVSNISFIVSLVYFVALYPQLVNVDGAPPLVEDLHLHLVNSVVILLEVAITALPVRLLHALYPLSYGLIYIIFSAIYWGVDHNNVLYPGVLDWNTPGRTIVVVLVLALVFVPVFQLLVFGLYRLRLVVHGRTSRWGR